MPVKRRGEKGRYLSHWGVRYTETELWDCVFNTGCDLLSLLHFVAGIETKNHRPPIDVARDAWNRLGADFLAAGGPGAGKWALDQFGQPGGEPCQ